MLIFCHVTYGAPVGDGAGNPSASYSGWAFNTATLQMEQVSGTWHGALLDPVPANTYLADGSVIWTVCPPAPTDGSPQDYTATVYHYQRQGELVGITTEPDSLYCGYYPPDTRSCNILIDDVVVSYDQATIICSNFVGPLEYSVDGNTRQLSNVFSDLSAGSYVATVYDRGASLPGCQQTRAFTVADSEPANAPRATVAPLPAFCLVGNPVVLAVTSPVPYQYVLVQVYVEDAHRSGQFSLVYDSKRRTASDCTTRLDVSEVLRGQLRLELDITPGYRQLTQPLRNWFVRVATVLPQNGRPGNWSTSNLGTALLGGLAPEPLLAGRDYWSTALLQRKVLSWQPLRKRVGPVHREVLQVLLRENDPATVSVRAYNANGQALNSASTTHLAPIFSPDPIPTASVEVPALPAAQQVLLMQLVIDLETVLASTAGVAQLRITVEQVDRNATGPRDSYPIVLDVATDLLPRQLVYENSLGCFDTLGLFGKMSAKLPLDATALETLVPLTGSQASLSLERSWPASTPAAPAYTCSTGWLSTEWLEYLQELVQPGRQVYEYLDGRLRPVVLTLKELPLFNEAESLSAATLEYRPAIKNEFYTDYARNTNRTGNIGAGW